MSSLGRARCGGKSTWTLRWLGAALIGATLPLHAQAGPLTGTAAAASQAQSGQAAEPGQPAGGALNPSLALLGTSPAVAPVSDLRVRPEPSVDLVPYNKSEGALKLWLTNRGAARRFLVEVGRPTLKTGDAAGRASVPERGGGDSFEMDLAKGAEVAVGVRLEGLMRLGLYEGLIRVRDVAQSDQESTRSYQVVRQSSGFDLTFRGDSLANGVLTLKPKTEGDGKFSFVVENPVGGAELKLKAEVASDFGGGEKANLVVTPKTPFTLYPGSSETIEVSVNNLPSIGDFQARLRFTDVSSGATKPLDVRLQPSFMRCGHWILLVVLVALGALGSVWVGVVIPTQAGRRELNSRVLKDKAKLAALPALGQLPRELVANELQRCEEEVAAVAWHHPSSSKRLTELHATANEVQKRVALLSEVSDLRREVQASSEVPSSLLDDFFRDLDSVAMDAARASLDLAKEQLTKVKQKLLAALSSSDLADFVGKAVASLAAVNAAAGPPTTNPASAEAPVLDGPAADAYRVMVTRLTKLRAAHAALGPSPSRAVLLVLDYEGQCASTYFERYLGSVMANHAGEPDFVKAGIDLVDELKRGRTELYRALSLVDSLERGVTPAAILRALEDLSKSASVKEPARRTGELLTFELVFNDNKVTESPLFRTDGATWTFAVDDTKAAERVCNGLKVGHLHRGKRRRTTSLRYTVSFGLDAMQRLSGVLDAMPKRPVFGTFSAPDEVAAFFVVVGGAVLIAVVTNYGEARPFSEIKDYFNPVLWGFGADRLKSLVSTRFGSATP